MTLKYRDTTHRNNIKMLEMAKNIQYKNTVNVIF